MSALVSLLVFSLDTLRLGLPVGSVQRVVCACEVTPLPGVPAQVLGAINLHGAIIPVLELRQRLRLPPRPIRPDDQFVVVRAGDRELAIVVDDSDGVREFALGQVTESGAVADGVAQLQGVVRLEDGLLLIEDPSRFLTLQEVQDIEQALEEHRDDHGP